MLLALLSVLALPQVTSPAVSIRVDSAHHQVIIAAGPFSVAGGEHAHHHGGHGPVLLPFAWPVGGWLRGVMIDLVDRDGRAVPRRLLHHLNIVNLDRRQLVLPTYERLLAVGQETGDLRLPAGIGVPIAREARMALLVAWASGAVDPGPVQLRVRFQWAPSNTSPAPVAVLPLPLDVGFEPGAASDAYDLPPGPSERRLEFTVPVDGRILAIGGHLHDYGTALRLEDADGGKTLVELRPEVDGQGRIVRIPIRTPGASGDGIRLRAGRRYRVVARYDNATGATLSDGAMGLMIGIFAPDRFDPRLWSVADTVGLALDARGLARLEVIGVLPAGWPIAP